MGDNDGNVKSGFENNSEKSNRILFIVHREQIAKQAMKSYKNIFGRSKTYGLLSGNSKDTDADILFATMQMMSKEEVMTQFPRNCFKTIVIESCVIIGLTRKNPVKSMGCEVESYFFDQKNRYSEAA